MSIEEGKKHLDDENFEKAYSIFKKLTKDKNPQAFYYIGIMYSHGKGKEVCKLIHLFIALIKAFKYFQRSAELNCYSGLNALGVAYETGKGVKQNMDKAIFYYEEACKLGSCKAYNNLGILFKNGKGVNNYYK
jgi:uncharacterized protein